MTTRLTPYDTDNRLEPQPQPLPGQPLVPLIGIDPSSFDRPDPDSVALVDVSGDRGCTVFTIVGKKCNDGSPGYLLSVSRYDENTAVEIDGDRVVPMTQNTLTGIEALADLAERSWEDFLYQARSGDYTDEEVNAAELRHRLAKETLGVLRGAYADDTPLGYLVKQIQADIAAKKFRDMSETAKTNQGA